MGRSAHKFYQKYFYIVFLYTFMYNAFNRWNKHLLTWFEGKLRVITHLPENRVNKCFVIPFTFNSERF